MNEDETAQKIDVHPEPEIKKVEVTEEKVEAVSEPAVEAVEVTEVATKPEVVERKADENTVFIGKKGVMGYVLAVVTQFNNGSEHVTLKARGKLISRAVDVAEIVRNRFLPEVEVKDITIKTEELASEDGSMSKVSAIEITLNK